MGAEQRSNLKAAETLLHQNIRDGAEGEEAGGDLIGIYDVLVDNVRLARALTDAGREPEERKALAVSLFGPRVGEVALKVIGLAATQHWSHSHQLTDAMRELALDSFVLAESLEGESDLSQQLVDAYALIARNRELRIQLSDLGEGDPKQRAELAGKIFEGHVSPIALRLIKRAAHDARYGHLVQFLRRVATHAAQMNGRMLVICTTARPLTEEQAKRMAELAERKWGRPVDMAQLVDPSILGGFRLDAGEEAIDTSVRTDLSLARLALVK